MADKSNTVWTRQVTSTVEAPTGAAGLKWMFSNEEVCGKQKWIASSVLVLSPADNGQPAKRLSAKIILSDADAAKFEAVAAGLFAEHAAALQKQFTAADLI